MQINTKYEIGQHVWFVYENRGEVCLYDDFIQSIIIEDDIYYSLELCPEDIKEKDVILYEDTDALLKKIIQITTKIRKEEQIEK